MLIPFPNAYHAAREAFLADADALERALGVTLERRRAVVDVEEDLTTDILLYTPPRRERLLILVSGTHGLEGFTGSAIQRHLMAGPLRGLKIETSGLLIVHGLNPWGFHHSRRVNPNNVDLNRNFDEPEGPLYHQSSADFEALEGSLCPKGPYGGGALALGRFLWGMLSALASQGMASLRQATLAGQYARPEGIFFGGAEPQPETRTFMSLFTEQCALYQEVLLCDLHTGYGERGQAYPLFGQGDSVEFKAYAAEGVKAEGGTDKTYTANGDLIAWAHRSAKRLQPEGVFDGLVVEIGTHGLGTVKQLQDLWAVVRENQTHLHGAASPALEAEARGDFRSLFFPEDPEWQRAALKSGGAVVEGFLKSRAFIDP